MDSQVKSYFCNLYNLDDFHLKCGILIKATKNKPSGSTPQGKPFKIFRRSGSTYYCVLHIPNCKINPIEKLRLSLDNIQRMSLHMLMPLLPLFNREENDFCREITRYS